MGGLWGSVFVCHYNQHLQDRGVFPETFALNPFFVVVNMYPQLCVTNSNQSNLLT